MSAAGASKTTVAIVGASTPSDAFPATALNCIEPFALSTFVTGSTSNAPAPPETLWTAVASGSKVRCAW